MVEDKRQTAEAAVGREWFAVGPLVGRRCRRRLAGRQVGTRVRSEAGSTTCGTVVCRKADDRKA